MQGMERRACTIVAADVVGYARLVAEREEVVIARLFTIRRDIINPAITAQGGRVVKTMGDGVIVAFDTPAQALHAAQHVQAALTVYEVAQPDTARIRFRIGINHGSVLIDGDDMLGDVVNVAARLESLAPSGGICVSRSVHDLLGADAGHTMVPLGQHFVRNVPTPIDVWQVTTGVETDAPNLPRARHDRPSVLVLPFDHRSTHPDDAVFADGIAEGVINALSRFRSISVIARGSSFLYRDAAHDVAQIARDTGVRYIVKGSVRRAGARLRVSAQLIEAAASDVIWSDTYDREVTDIFDMQDAITQCVVVGLAPEIGAHERRITRSKPTHSLSAWEMCQKGMTHFDQRTGDNVVRAHAMFRAAAGADDTYALPQALLARLHAMRIFTGRSADPASDIMQGMQYATRAIALDDRLEIGHQAMAQLLLVQGREADARAALARAMALNDNDAFVYSAQTYINLFQRDPDTTEMEKAGLTALRLSPKDPLAWSYNWMLVMAVWIRDGHLGENVRHYLDAAERLPGAEAFVHAACGVTALRRGDREKAQISVGRMMTVRPDFSLQTIRHAFHFPKWPELVAGVDAELQALLPMGLGVRHI